MVYNSVPFASVRGILVIKAMEFSFWWKLYNFYLILNYIILSTAVDYTNLIRKLLSTAVDYANSVRKLSSTAVDCANSIRNL